MSRLDRLYEEYNKLTQKMCEHYDKYGKESIWDRGRLNKLAEQIDDENDRLNAEYQASLDDKPKPKEQNPATPLVQTLVTLAIAMTFVHFIAPQWSPFSNSSDSTPTQTDKK